MSAGLAIRRAIDRMYRWPFNRLFSPTLFRYAACGGITLVVDALFYALIYHGVVAGRYINLGVVVVSPHIASLLIVFPMTFLTGFWLNRYVTFRTLPVSAFRQMGRYLLSIFGALVLTYLCMKIFVEGFHWWPTPSKALTSVVSAVYTYLVARDYTFRGANEKHRNP